MDAKKCTVCSCEGTELIDVEVVRKCDRASHKAAGIDGIERLPRGAGLRAGIETFRLCRLCAAEKLEEEAVWARF